jgi:hypothetical protein
MFRVLLEMAGAWRSSARHLQTTRLVVIPCLVGLATGTAAIGFVELLNLVQWCVSA